MKTGLLFICLLILCWLVIADATPLRISPQEESSSKQLSKTSLLASADSLKAVAQAILSSIAKFETNDSTVASDSIMAKQLEVYQLLKIANQLIKDHNLEITTQYTPISATDSSVLDNLHRIEKEAFNYEELADSVKTDALQTEDDTKKSIELHRAVRITKLSNMAISSAARGFQLLALDTTNLQLKTDSIETNYNAKKDSLLTLHPALLAKKTFSHTQQPESEALEYDTIVKGYSPFTTETDTFLVPKDTLKKEALQQPAYSLLQQAAQRLDSIYQLKGTMPSQSPDSLFHLAVNDSIYPHEMISAFDKASLKKAWYQYMEIEPLAEASPSTKPIAIPEKPGTTLAVVPIPIVKEEIIKEEKIESTVPKTETIAKVEEETETPPIVTAEVKKELPEEKQEVMVTPPEKQTEAKEEAEELVAVAVTQEPTKEDIESTPVETIKEKEITPETQQQPVTSPLKKKSFTEFWIQIAASRTKLKPSYLEAIYSGPLPIEHRFEENWHKYQIGGTKDYQAAQKNIKKIKIDGAFIAAYEGDEKKTLWKVIQQKQSITQQDTLLFVIQFAASRTQLSDRELRSKTNSPEKIRMIKEDNWFKYQLITGSSYKKALQIWQQNRTGGTFLVAYLNNNKIPMTEALRLLKVRKQ